MNSLPPLLFVLGKGGVGRSSVSAALGAHFASRGERVLVVEWALEDPISPWFGRREATHAAQEILPGLSVMNFSPDDAIREYFVDHLRMKLLYKIVVENRHVQKLVNAAPGIHELFFLGRLFWLVSLAKEERGWSYDRIIVDAPATGHSSSLFEIAQTMASFGFTGPLAHECSRVAGMLADPKKVGAFLVTLPEELPTEEALEFFPRLVQELGRPPLGLVVNRSVSNAFPTADTEPTKQQWLTDGVELLKSGDARHSLNILYLDLMKRKFFEGVLRDKLESRTTHGCLNLDEYIVSDANIDPKNVVMRMRDAFGTFFDRSAS